MQFTRYYLRAVGVITLGLGFTLLFFPAFVGSMLFSQVDVPGLFFVSITGSTLIGYSVLNMLASLHKNHGLAELAVWGNLATLLVATIITLVYYGRFDSFGWLVLAQHTVFAGGFIVCARKLQKTSA